MNLKILKIELPVCSEWSGAVSGKFGRAPAIGMVAGNYGVINRWFQILGQVEHPVFKHTGRYFVRDGYTAGHKRITEIAVTGISFFYRRFVPVFSHFLTAF
jgi:hypothetical protein